jgi:hypothetical protein
MLGGVTRVALGAVLGAGVGASPLPAISGRCIEFQIAALRLSFPYTYMFT